MRTKTETDTETFTRTDSKKLGSRVAADLDQIRSFYGKPRESLIEDYLTELSELLVEPWVDWVRYGFKLKNEGYILAVEYEVKADGSIKADDNPGNIPADKDVSDATWASYLSYRDPWYDLSQDEKDEIKSDIPINRSSGSKPQNASNTDWKNSKEYSQKDVGLNRKTLS